MTAYSEQGNPAYNVTLTSAMAAVDENIVLEIDQSIDDLSHVFLGVQQYDGPDPESDALVVGSAGTYTVTVKTRCTLIEESPAEDVIPADAPVTISWAANTVYVKVAPDSVAGDPTHYRVVIVANRN